MLGVDNDRSKYLFYDGMDDSSLPTKWYTFDNGCPKCLMSPVDACVCFGSSNWIKTMAYESLITLHSVLAPERYQGIVDDSLTFGCYSVLLNVVKNKKFYRELVERKYKQFLDFMDNIQPDLQQYPGYDSSRQMLHDFNNLWSYTYMQSDETERITAKICARARCTPLTKWRKNTNANFDLHERV